MRYCYSLTEADFGEMPHLAVRPDVGFELRLDTPTAPLDAAALRAAAPRHDLLATYRTRPHLGTAETADRETTGWALRRACLDAGFPLIDIELDEPDLHAKIDTVQAAGARVVLSHHDLGDGAGLDAALDRALATRADIIKIIATGHGVRDILRLRSFYARAAGRPLVHFAMGAEYAATRVLCLVAGAPFTFITPRADAAVAPGQLTLEAMDAVFRPTDIDPGRLRLFAVIGSPIAHSKSPAFHNAPLKQRDPNALFVALPAQDAADLDALWHGMPEVCGLAVTKPMKGWAFAHATTFSDPHCAALGAVNTLLRRPDGIHAANTDLLAMQDLLADFGAGTRVRILGYGGLGKAVAAACLALDQVPEVCNRTPGKVHDPRVHELPWAERHAPGAAVVVQATSVGMAPDVAGCPLERLPEGTRLLIETIYNPIETRLMTLARAAGVPVVDGLALFQGQARIQNQLFLQTLG